MCLCFLQISYKFIMKKCIIDDVEYDLSDVWELLSKGKGEEAQRVIRIKTGMSAIPAWRLSEQIKKSGKVPLRFQGENPAPFPAKTDGNIKETSVLKADKCISDVINTSEMVAYYHENAERLLESLPEKRSGIFRRGVEGLISMLTGYTPDIKSLSIEELKSKRIYLDNTAREYVLQGDDVNFFLSYFKLVEYETAIVKNRFSFEHYMDRKSTTELNDLIERIFKCAFCPEIPVLSFYKNKIDTTDLEKLKNRIYALDKAGAQLYKKMCTDFSVPAGHITYYGLCHLWRLREFLKGKECEIQ